MLRAWIVTSVLVCACGGGKPHGSGAPPTSKQAPIENKQVEAPPTPALAETPMMAFERFARDMCACAPGDAGCATRVSDHMTTWSQEMASKSKEPLKMSDEEIKKATEIGTRMGECMQAAMSTPSP